MNTPQNILFIFQNFSPSFNCPEFYFCPIISFQQNQFLSNQTFSAKAQSQNQNCSDFDQKQQNSQQANCSKTHRNIIIRRKKNCKKKNKRVQCKSRNNYSNILKNFIWMIKTNCQFKNQFKKVAKKFDINEQFSVLFKSIKKLLPKNLNYVSPLSLKNIILDHEKSMQFHQKIKIVLRIMLKHYLRLEAPIFLSTFFKGKKQSTADMINACRKLEEIMFMHA